MEEFTEGDRCPEDECWGTLGFEEVEGCSCHILSPCNACANNNLVCSECGWVF